MVDDKSISEHHDSSIAEDLQLASWLEEAQCLRERLDWVETCIFRRTSFLHSKVKS